ncbi:hypothetical protein DH26_gp045 [Chloriridovirus anopheles1]|uniref:Uncharacterized protein n=1 Tax=Chloriridovirus anopheles1 TaxID=1465751 RepID=W8QE30_9VIRU|nr:hypothetical protein DH26_gp045 [Anopheles minimus iridovirus]AHL67540.1 hypothetical protein AMIV_045 [Anopheles minimus iridovirus]
MSEFKVYDPIAKLIASSGGGGSGLPLTGGTLTGNLTLTAPAKIIQAQSPVNPQDLTNKAYVDGLISGGPFLPLSGGTMSGAISQPVAPINANDLVNKSYTDGAFQSKKPSAVSGHIAIFGSGADSGQTVDSTYSVDTNPINPPSTTTLWPSTRIVNSMQLGANIYKATASLSIAATTSKVFSTGNTNIGPVNWPNLGTTLALASTGIATITNSFPYTTYYILTFVASSASSLGDANINFQFLNEGTSTSFGVVKTLNFYQGPPAITTPVHLTAFVSVAATSSFAFSVAATSTATITLDPASPDNVCTLTIQRVA